MSKTITQRVVFKNASAADMYAMFLDSKQHTAITGGVVAKITNKEGGSFSVHGGYATGKNLQLTPNKLIVQSWYASDWPAGTPDSTFILLFTQQDNDVFINMTHANLPDDQADDIKKGWTDYYWTPWKQHLKSLK